jgi:hypothetical protein
VKNLKLFFPLAKCIEENFEVLVDSFRSVNLSARDALNCVDENAARLEQGLRKVLGSTQVAVIVSNMYIHPIDDAPIVWEWLGEKAARRFLEENDILHELYYGKTKETPYWEEMNGTNFRID